MNTNKLILDCTCGSRSIWFEKNEPHTLYCDRRREHHESDYGAHRTIDVDPDVIADFTALPFDDNTFHLVVFDPPHIIGHSNGWINKRYGDYPTKEEALESVSKGIAECMRVLKPNGTLIFKWADLSVTTAEILKRIDYKPLFGHRSGKASNTHWMAFMKFDDNVPTIESEVQHGRWKCIGEYEEFSEEMADYLCDSCGYVISRLKNQKPKFCEGCGAQMDLTNTNVYEKE